MDDEIQLDTIEWTVPEYFHKERGNDWFWTLGLISIVGCGIAVWMHTYVFAIFIALSGASLIMFTMRPPDDVIYKISTEGLAMGKDLYKWKSLKSFNIKASDHETYDKLLIETSKNFLPIYTIPIHKEKVPEVKAALQKVLPRGEIDESASMVFMEKLGF